GTDSWTTLTRVFLNQDETITRERTETSNSKAQNPEKLQRHGLQSRRTPLAFPKEFGPTRSEKFGRSTRELRLADIRSTWKSELRGSGRPLCASRRKSNVNRETIG